MINNDLLKDICPCRVPRFASQKKSVLKAESKLLKSQKDLLICASSDLLSYHNCCFAMHYESALYTADIEHVMRSRYSAFVFKNVDYLLKTTYLEAHSDPDQAAMDLKKTLQKDFDLVDDVVSVKEDLLNRSQTTPQKTAEKISKKIMTTNWLGLSIVNVFTEQQQVEFKAYYKTNGRVICLHERSQFVKSNHPESYFMYDQNASVFLSSN
jgi:uncharacterized protein YchJ